jgi:uroporphyrinogen decarboxylase
MNHRERILAVVRHELVDRLPTDIWATSEVWARLRTALGVNTNLDVYDCLDIDGIMGIAPPYIGPPCATRGGIRYDEWGMGYRTQPYDGGAYDEQVVFPLQPAQSLAELQSYAWPSPDWYDYSRLPELAAQYHDRSVQVGYTAIFYWHNRMRGLEQSLVDPLPGRAPVRLFPGIPHALL